MVTVGRAVFARLSSTSITVALVSFVSLWGTVTAPLPRRACEARVHADGVDNNRCILSYKTLEELWQHLQHSARCRLLPCIPLRAVEHDRPIALPLLVRVRDLLLILFEWVSCNFSALPR